jgi:parvulin-like peptidyl-prolyl isomerase
MLLLITGCGGDKKRMTDAELERVALAQEIELVESKGGLVLVVGGEKVTSDDVIKSTAELNGRFVSPAEHFRPLARTSDLEHFKTRARPQLKDIIQGKISRILLYQYARKEAGGNIEEALDKAAESEYRKLVLKHGGDEVKADEQLAAAGMDRESFKEKQKRAILIQSYLGTELSSGRPITYRELIETYDQMKDEYFAIEARITFRLIDIRPDRLEVADPNQNRTELAKDLAGKLLERLEAGEDFGELARQYSHGHMRTLGGLWAPVEPQALAPPYNLIAAQAEKTEPGQVAEPIITDKRIFIMKLEEKRSAGYERFEKAEVQELVERKVRSDRYNEASEQLQARLVEEAQIGRADEFIEFCLEEIYKLSRRQ